MTAKRMLWLVTAPGLLWICGSAESGFAADGRPGEEYPAMTENGAWCWFSDPRAVYHSGDTEQIISGWVRDDGSVEMGALDLETNTVTAGMLYPALEFDDHDNPAFVVRPDGRTIAMYTKHGKDSLYLSISKGAEDITTWEAARTLRPNAPGAVKEYGNDRYTYANPFFLSKENNRLYCFGRWAGFKPNMIWSDDGGDSWSDAKVIVFRKPFENGNRPYVKYFSNGKSKVHMIFTDGHPRNEPLNSVYYTYYEKGAFHKADGTKICGVADLPFEPRDASVIYNATESAGRAWVWDLCENEAGHPVALYSRLPKETDHRYHYASFDGQQWLDHEICKAGKWFPQTVEGKTEKEPHYSAGMTLDPNRPNTVYLSRSVGDRFEIEEWTTQDRGAVWTNRAITSNSAHDQVRPYVPRGMPADGPGVVLWMQNRKYIHYTNYSCAIRYARIR